MSTNHFNACIFVALMSFFLTSFTLYADTSAPSGQQCNGTKATVVVAIEQKAEPSSPVPASAVASPAPASAAASLGPASAVASPAPASVAKSPASKSWYAGKFWALLPPLFAIVLALITKEVYPSLFLGVFFGGLLVAEGKVLKIIDVVINAGFIAAIKDNAGIFMFLVILGIIVALLNRTGAAQALGDWAKTHIKSRIGAVIMTFALGAMFFIDDYFDCLTTGSVMLPVADTKRISRAKLAYIIDSTAAPVCMIVPISSWAAAVSSYTEGTQYSGLELFCRAIPYNFYSLLTILFIMLITFMKIDFGPMAKHERNAIEKGDLFTEGDEVDNEITQPMTRNGRISDLIIPIIFLIVACVFALVYKGGLLTGKSFIQAFSCTDAMVALPWGGGVALIFTILFLLARNILSTKIPRSLMPFVINGKEAMSCIAQGFCAMVPALLILTLATALKNMTHLLEVKEFIRVTMQGAAGNFYHFLPVVIFIVGCVIAFATGTSWGTFGILIPIVVNIFPADSPLLFVGMSACLAGAVCGDHCSPISDTTIMSAAGARCAHLNHVTTQLPYAIYVALFSCLGFLLAGFIPNWYFVFPCTAFSMFLGLIIIKRRQRS